MKLIIFVVVMLSIPLFLVSQKPETPKLVILPFQVQGEVSPEFGNTVTDLTANRLNTTQYFILDRSALEKSLQEKLLRESLTAENAMALQNLKIQFVMFGQIAKAGDKYFGGYRIVEISTARIIMSDSIQSNGVEEFLDGLYRSFVKNGFQQDKDYILVKREQWEMLNKFNQQTKTLAPNFDKQVESYLTTWKQSITQNKNYSSVLKTMTLFNRDLDMAMEDASKEELKSLQNLQNKLQQTMEMIQQLQKLDRQQYEKIATAVSQGDLSLVTSLIGQYASETTHFRIMLDVLAKFSYQVPISFLASPSAGYMDKGAGPDPLLNVQVFSFYPQQRYYPNDWKMVGNGIFEKDDIVGEKELGYLTIMLDFEHNYGLRMQLFERNLLSKESLGNTEIDITSLVQSGADQASFWSQRTPYGTMTIKIQTKRTVFPNPLPKFRE